MDQESSNQADMARNPIAVAKKLKAYMALEETPYACVDLTQLSGGTANLVYRGELPKPMPESAARSASTTTVIVKRSANSSAMNNKFPLDISRVFLEKTMLEALAGADTLNADQSVQAPAFYLLVPCKNDWLSVTQDFPNTVDLGTVLQSYGKHSTHSLSTKVTCKATGLALGSWLRNFHAWASEPAQEDLRSKLDKNVAMRKLKCQITYDSFIDILQRYPELVAGHEDLLSQVQDGMCKEFTQPAKNADRARGIIHGDFWTGNVLVSNDPPKDGTSPDLVIIDWELAQFGHRSVDIGGMLADLYEASHFHGTSASLDILLGFLDGYERPADEIAFTAATYMGVHMICWYSRRDINAPLPFPLEVVLPYLMLGRDFVIKGWTRDKEWLRQSILGAWFN